MYIPKLKITVGQQISEKSQLRSLKKYLDHFLSLSLLLLLSLVLLKLFLSLFRAKRWNNYFIIHMQ